MKIAEHHLTTTLKKTHGEKLCSVLLNSHHGKDKVIPNSHPYLRPVIGNAGFPEKDHRKYARWDEFSTLMLVRLKHVRNSWRAVFGAGSLIEAPNLSEITSNIKMVGRIK